MYQLMNKDEVLCTFAVSFRQETGVYTLSNIVCDETLPWMIGDLELWLMNRSAPKHRAHIAMLLQKLGMDNLKGFIDYTKCLSLTDTFWVNQDGRFKWKDINLFDNDFDDTIAQVAFDGGMFGDTFSTTSPEFTTDGAFAKCWVKKDNEIYLIKKGSEGGANTGFEPYSEQYAADLLQVLDVSHVSYEVIKYRGSIACRCPIMTSKEAMLVPMTRCIKKPLINEVVDFAKKNNFYDALAEMLVFDYLVVNDDRHLNNFGVLVDPENYGVLSMAPVYDNGAGLLPMAMMEYDLKDAASLERYVLGKTPRFYPSFYDTAKALCTPAIRKKLKQVCASFDFKQQKHQYELPADRLDILSQMIRDRARKLI